MGIPYAEVIGDPIEQSKSPLIHNFWLERSYVEGEYRATRVTEDALPVYFAARRADPDWRGCNVTMPLKRAVMPYLDRVREDAEEAGAVNTIVNDEGALSGRNYDGYGFILLITSDAVSERMPLHIVDSYEIIGAGGAARAIGQALRSESVALNFFNRTTSKADDLAKLCRRESFFHSHRLALLGGEEPLEEVRRRELGYRELVEMRPRRTTMIVNATCLGMRGKPSLPIRLDLYPEGTIVLDLVYDPIETPLLREARRRGMPTIDGLEMLVEQAAISFEYLFEATTPREDDAELRELLLR